MLCVLGENRDVYRQPCEYSYSYVRIQEVMLVAKVKYR